MARISIFIVLLCAVALQAENPPDWIDRFRTVDGWNAAKPDGQPISPEYLFDPYSSGTTPYLVHGNLTLEDFDQLSVEIYSRTDTEIELFVQSSRGYIYRAVRRLAADRVTLLRLRPDDFLSRPEETFLQVPLDASDIAPILVIHDFGTENSFLPRKNRLLVHSVAIDFKELPVYSDILRIRNEVVISSDWELKGDVIIEPEGRLILRGAEMRVSGRILNFGGQLLIEQSRIHFLNLPGRGGGITLHNEASLIMRESRISTTGFLDIRATDRSRIRFEDVRASRGVRLMLEGGSRLRAEDVRELGEVRSSPDSDVLLIGVDDVLVWLYAGENIAGEFSLPPPGRISAWNGVPDFPIRISQATGVRWGLRILPGVSGILRRADIEAAEITVRDGLEADFSGLRNGKLPPGRMLQSEAYQLIFDDSVHIEKWKLSAEEGSSLVIRNALFSDASVEGRQATMTIIDSESDSGGSVRIELGGQSFIEDSSINGELVTASGATARIFGSRLTGSAVVANGGRLVLRDTYSKEPVTVAAGGSLQGTPLPLTPEETGDEEYRPNSPYAAVEIGGIDTFLPRVSGFEEFENIVIPYFEISLFRRFFVRFPEFEYRVYRGGYPRYPGISLKTAALFERPQRASARGAETAPSEEAYGEGAGAPGEGEIVLTPLSFEVSAAAETRIIGPLWGEAEIAADPSDRSYAGYRMRAALRFEHQIPYAGVDAELFTGLQFADGDYLRSFYGPRQQPDALRLERVDYGGKVVTGITPRWSIHTDVAVFNRMEDLVEYLPAEPAPLDWRVTLALVYRLR